MISRISSVSPNFSGQVKIGKDDKEKKQIAGAILDVPENQRIGFIDTINSFKKSIVRQTPNDTALTIHVKRYDWADFENSKCIFVDVTDDNDGDRRFEWGCQCAFSTKQGDNPYFIKNMKNELNRYKNQILNSFAPGDTGKLQSPKTKEEVLNLLG